MEFVIRVAPPTPARLEIFDIAGRRVRTLLDREVTESVTSASWDGENDNSEPVASGVYFARLTAGGATQTERTVLLK
jgi:flagellar hook assembly protein FlgD